jgi:type I restriction enzyme S subunit
VSDTWNLKWRHFREIIVSIPGHREQEIIAEALEEADRQAALLEAQRSMLVDEKRALMQQLLTGKRRVKLDTAA